MTRGALHLLASATFDTTAVRFLITVSEAAEGELTAVATTCILGVAIPDHSILRTIGDTLVLETAGRTFRQIRGQWSRGADVPMPDAPPLRALEPTARRMAIPDRDSAGRARWWVIGPALAETGNPDAPIGITQVADTTAQWHAPPNPSFEQFAKLRPKRVAQGYGRSTTFVNEIGPWQQVERRIWFGATFYDGEGQNGLGGIGYFDLDRRAYRMMWTAGSTDASVTAIFVDHAAAAVGLARNCECEEAEGSGAAYFRFEGDVSQPIVIPGLTTAIGRAGTSLVLLSTRGLYRTDRVSSVIAVPILLER